MRRFRGFVTWLQTCKPKLFAALKVALIVFLGQFLLDLVGFVGLVREWADGPDGTPFPSLNPLGKAFISALSGAVSGLLLYVYNTVRPSSAPQYPDHPQRPGRDRGYTLIETLVFLVVFVVVVLLLVKLLDRV